MWFDPSEDMWPGVLREKLCPSQHFLLQGRSNPLFIFVETLCADTHRPNYPFGNSVAATFCGLTHRPRRTKASFSTRPISPLQRKHFGTVQHCTVPGVDSGWPLPALDFNRTLAGMVIGIRGGLAVLVAQSIGGAIKIDLKALNTPHLAASKSAPETQPGWESSWVHLQASRSAIHPLCNKQAPAN